MAAAVAVMVLDVRFMLINIVYKYICLFIYICEWDAFRRWWSSCFEEM